jgi:hypothetical protein
MVARHTPSAEIALSRDEADFWPAAEFVVRSNLSAVGVPEYGLPPRGVPTYCCSSP